LFFVLRMVRSLSLATLPASLFLESSILQATLGHPGVAFLWGTAIIPILFYRELRWDVLLPVPGLKYVLLAAHAALALQYSTYEYNFVSQQTHDLDRCLVLLFGTLVWFSPVFAAPAAWSALLVAQQFDVPLATTLTDKTMLFEIAFLFHAFVLMRLVRPKTSWPAFFIAAVSLVGLHYSYPAVEKQRLDWLRHEQIEFLAAGSYHLLRWPLAWSPGDGYGMPAWTGPVMAIVTLLIEFSGFVLLFNRRAAITILIACVALHLGIYVSSGIFFWMWIVLDVALAVAICRFRSEDCRCVFGIHAGGLCFALQAAAILAGQIHDSVLLNQQTCGAVGLAWYDTPLSYRFHVEIVGSDGITYQAPPYVFAPFDSVFSQARFYSAISEKQLVDCGGTTRNLEVLDALKASRNATDVDAVRQKLGTDRYTSDYEAAVRSLLAAYGRHATDKQTRSVFQYLPAVPRHFSSFADRTVDQPVFTPGQCVPREIRLRLVEVLLRKNCLTPVLDRVVLREDIHD